jgi:DNA-binding PadR family transcriptional regulator
MDATGLPSGTVYPVLRRLEKEGLVRADWEDAQAARDELRPPRRYYEMTPSGETLLTAARARYRMPREIPRARGFKPSPSRS